MAHHVTLRCRFFICQVYDPSPPWLVHCSLNDTANIRHMDAVEQLSLMINDPRRTVAKRIKGAAPGAIDASYTE